MKVEDSKATFRFRNGQNFHVHVSNKNVKITADVIIWNISFFWAKMLWKKKKSNTVLVFKSDSVSLFDEKLSTSLC